MSTNVMPRNAAKSSKMAAAMRLVAELDPAMRAFLDGTIARNADHFGTTRMAFLTDTQATEEQSKESEDDEQSTTDETKDEDGKEGEEQATDSKDADKQESSDLTEEEQTQLAEDLERQEAERQADDPPLGEAGQRAYERVKAERTSLKTENETLKAEIETLKAAKADSPKGKSKDGKSDESSSELAQVRAMLAEDALLAAAEAAGFSSPALVARLIDVPFKGVRVDREALGHALDDLAAENPGLLKAAPTPKPKAKGSAGRGQQTGGTTSSSGQLTFAEAAKLTPDQLAKAAAEGRTRNLFKSGF